MVDNNIDYAAALPQMVRNVIVGNFHTMSPEEAARFDMNEFADFYESFLDRMRLPCVPLQVIEDPRNASKKTLVRHETFERRLDEEFQHTAFDAYRFTFNKYFDMACAGETRGEDAEKKDPGKKPDQHLNDDEQQKSPPLPQKQWFDEDGDENLVCARQKNSVAVKNEIIALLGGEAEKPDGYGMIENRRALFDKTLDAVRREFALPAFDVVFDKNGKPSFKDLEQKQTIQETYIQREKELSDALAKMHPKEENAEAKKHAVLQHMHKQWVREEIVYGEATSAAIYETKMELTTVKDDVLPRKELRSGYREIADGILTHSQKEVVLHFPDLNFS